MILILPNYVDDDTPFLSHDIAINAIISLENAAEKL